MHRTEANLATSKQDDDDMIEAMWGDDNTNKNASMNNNNNNSHSKLWVCVCVYSMEL